MAAPAAGMAALAATPTSTLTDVGLGYDSSDSNESEADGCLSANSNEVDGDAVEDSPGGDTVAIAEGAQEEAGSSDDNDEADVR